MIARLVTIDSMCLQITMLDFSSGVHIFKLFTQKFSAVFSKFPIGKNCLLESTIFVLDKGSTTFVDCRRHTYKLISVKF